MKNNLRNITEILSELTHELHKYDLSPDLHRKSCETLNSLLEDNFLDELTSDYVPLKTKLKQANLTRKQAKEKVDNFIQQFKQVCAKYDFPSGHKLNFCKVFLNLLEKAPHEKNEEIIWLYAVALLDKGLLFYTDETKFPASQAIENYLEMPELIESTICYLKETAYYKSEFENLLAAIKKQRNKKSNSPNEKVNPDDEHFLLQTTLEYIGAPPSEEKEKILADNIYLLCSMLAESKELTKIAPLFICQIMTKHKKRLISSKDFNFTMERLFEYKFYQIEKDNDKNFDNYLLYLELFWHLGNYFSKNPAVDMELSRHAFTRINNLCQWYYQFCEYDEKLNFVMPIEIFVSTYLGLPDDANCSFAMNVSCTFEEFENFKEKSYYPKIEKQILTYIRNNRHILQKLIDLDRADYQIIINIIDEILQNAQLPMKYILSEKMPVIQYDIYGTLVNEIDRETEETFIHIGKELIDWLSISS